MKAAFYDGKARMRLEDVLSVTPGAGEAVVQVKACGICGSDLHSFHGQWQQPPVTPGHEIAGVVVAVGEGVSTVRPGDAVAIEPLVTCGECRHCRAGQYNVCSQQQFLSWSLPGGFAEQILAPARCLLPLPEGPARAFGALVEPLSVAVHGLRRAPLMGGDTVLILGAGAIGLLAAAAARVLGAGKVFITAKHDHQAALAQSLGVDRVIRPGAENPEEVVRDLTAGDGADVVLDSVGGSLAVDLAVKLARNGGAISLIGAYVLPARVNLQAVISRELRLSGSNCYGIIGGHRDFCLSIDLLASGKVNPEPLVTHHFPLAEIQQAFETAADKGSGAVKVLVEP